MKHSALYIRVSTDAQFEEGYSVEAQQKKLEQFCNLKDIEDYEFYIDGGWSGSNIDRPEMKRMINDIYQGRVDNVIVYKLDRLSRSQKDTLYLLEDVFEPYKVSFMSLNENFDTTTSYGKAMVGILSVFAQLERENIRERTRMGMYERVKEGLWMGGGRVPFGYDYDQNKNILIPNEHAKDVQAIFDLYLQGFSTTKIASMFDISGDRQVSLILSRLTYLGKIYYKGEVFEGQHEAIIDQDTFDQVQALKQKRAIKKTADSDYLLTGLVYCGKCGNKMRYQKWGTGVKMYCYSQQKSKPNLIKDPNCDNKKVDAMEVENAVINDLFELTDNIIATANNKNSEKYKKRQGIEILQQKYDFLSAKIKKLFNLYAENDNPLLLETINENQDELNEVAKLLKNEKSSLLAVNDIDERNEVIHNLRNKWDNLTTRERRQAIKICIDKVIITDDAIDIIYAI